MSAVVDASVAVKWVIDEPFYTQARALRRDAAVNGERLIVPPHFTGEVLNGIYRRLYRAGAFAITEQRATAAVRDFLAFRVEIITPPDLYERAYDFARAHRLPTIYDSLYVTLAQLGGVELWTADERLLNAVRSIAPAVRWIGDYASGSC